jgi:hypothetical protein
MTETRQEKDMDIGQGRRMNETRQEKDMDKAGEGHGHWTRQENDQDKAGEGLIVASCMLGFVGGPRAGRFDRSMQWRPEDQNVASIGQL